MNIIKTLTMLMGWRSIATPELVAGEKVVFSAIAARRRGPFSGSGKIVLTTNRLMYLPLGIAHNPLTLPVAEIVSTRPEPRHRGLIGGLPGAPLFSVILTNGDSVTFQCGWAGRMRKEIEHLIAERKGASAA